MKYFAAMALAASLVVLTACTDRTPPPAQTGEPRPQPECPRPDQPGQCLPDR